MTDEVPQSYWKALFKFAASVGADDLVNRAAPPATMSAEDQQWLQEAMEQLAKETDPVRKLKENIEMLSRLDIRTPTDEQLQTAIAASDQIEEMTCDIDMAAVFFRLNGLRVIVALIGSDRAELRSAGAAIIGQISQNNAPVQQQLLDAHLLPVLLEMLDTDRNSKVRIKTLFAISCFVRGNEAGMVSFRDLDGFAYLMRILRSSADDQRLHTKAAFVIASLAGEQHDDQAGHMAQLLASALLVVDVDSNACEHLVLALARFVGSCGSIVERAALKEMLIKRAKLDIDTEEQADIARLVAAL